MASRSKLQAVLLVLGASVSIDAFAAEPPGAAASAPPLPAALEACARTRIDAERLACYDQVVAPQVRGAAEAPGAAASAPSTAAPVNAVRPQPLASDNGSYLDEF